MNNNIILKLLAIATPLVLASTQLLYISNAFAGVRNEQPNLLEQSSKQNSNCASSNHTTFSCNDPNLQFQSIVDNNALGQQQDRGTTLTIEKE
jgi:hypothetical protein